MSELEDTLAFQLRALSIPFASQVMAIQGRKFVWDFKVDDILIEIQGGVYMTKGGHNTGNGITRDCEKANLATLHGYRTLFFTADMVKSGQAVNMIEKCTVVECGTCHARLSE